MKDLNSKQKENILQRIIGNLDSFCVNCILVFVLTIFLVGIFIIITMGAGTGTQGEFIFDTKFSIAETFVNLINNIPYLPFIAILIPLVGGPIEAYFGRKSETLRDSTVVNSTFVTFLMILAMYPQVVEGSIDYFIPGVFGVGLHFTVDMLGFIMAMTAGVLWLMVTIYTRDYMRIERHRNRFSLWMAVTFGGILGTIFAGDILTMFLFFEMMTLTSYMLVAHNQSKESMLAGNNVPG